MKEKRKKDRRKRNNDTHASNASKRIEEWLTGAADTGGKLEGEGEEHKAVTYHQFRQRYKDREVDKVRRSICLLACGKCEG